MHVAPVRILVTRHGQSEANIRRVFANGNSGYPLTALGQTQSASMARALARYAPTVVYSSPVLRARQTADYVADACAAPLEEVEALREFSVGDLEGRDDDEAWAAYAEIRRRWRLDDWDARLPGGESLRDAHDRLAGFLEALRTQHAGQTVVVVSHGGLYSAVLPRLCALAPCPAGHADLGNASVGLVVDDGLRLTYTLHGTPATHCLWMPT